MYVFMCNENQSHWHYVEFTYAALDLGVGGMRVGVF